MDIKDLTPDQLVNRLWDKMQRNDVITALVGGLTATELRRVTVSEDLKAALIRGLKHTNSKIRWWCIQLMDHVADESYRDPLLEAAYNDPTPKNRRHAIHALSCEKCKPNHCRLSIDIRDDLRRIIETDPDPSVRETAQHELAEMG